MDALEILFLFFGMPLVILGMGLRRGLGPRRVLLLFLLSGAVGLYATMVESILRAEGRGLPIPAYRDWNAVRVLAAFLLPAATLGTLAGVLLRIRDEDRPRDGGEG